MARQKAKLGASCPICKTPYPVGAAFCAHCGRPRGSGGIVEPAPAPEVAAVPFTVSSPTLPNRSTEPESLVPPTSAAPAAPTSPPVLSPSPPAGSAAPGGVVPGALVAGLPPAPPPLPVPPPPANSIESGGVDAWTRPPFPEEQEVLRKYGSSPAVRAGRVLGLLCGAGSAMLGVEGFLGFPFDPVMYPTVLVVLAMIGLAAGGTARALRKRAASALKAGQVTEAAGPAQWGPGIRGGRIQLQLAGVRIAVPRKWAAGVQSGTSLRAAWVSAGRLQHIPGTGRVQPVMLVSANGAPLSHPQLGFLSQ